MRVTVIAPGAVLTVEPPSLRVTTRAEMVAEVIVFDPVGLLAMVNADADTDCVRSSLKVNVSVSMMPS